MRAARATTLAVLALLAALPGAPRANASEGDVETLTLAAVNRGRSGQGLSALVMHAGMRDQTRRHSATMASSGTLDHSGADARKFDASPDPAEGNGPPDDGFQAAYCENVARRFMPSETDQQVADGFYNAWFQSTQGHRECMFDAERKGFNAAGVGVARAANGEWFATLYLVVDTTPPTGAGAGLCPGHSSDARPQVVGTQGNDVLAAPNGGVVCGVEGNDVIKAAPGGMSQLEGGPGSDILCARQNAPGDVLDGGTGVDRGRWDNSEAPASIERFAVVGACA